MSHLVALISDPELSSRLAAAAEAAGHEATCAATRPMPGTPARSAWELLVVDASSDAVDGLTLIDSMRAGGELQGVRTLAFHADEDEEAQARAKEVGVDVVLPQSRIRAEGAAVIGRLLA